MCISYAGWHLSQDRRNPASSAAQSGRAKDLGVAVIAAARYGARGAGLPPVRSRLIAAVARSRVVGWRETVANRLLRAGAHGLGSDRS